MSESVETAVRDGDMALSEYLRRYIAEEDPVLDVGLVRDVVIRLETRSTILSNLLAAHLDGGEQ